MTRSRKVAASQALLGAALGLTAGCATNPATGERELMFVSEGQERDLGAQADQQIVAQLGVLPEDLEVVQYVQRVGQRVAKESESPHDFTIRVIDDPVINAFALPGGFVYVTRGILGHLPNEAALASVLGHEAGHVAARHSSQRMTQAILANVGVIGIQILGGGALGGLSGTAAQLLLLKFSRDDEREADLLGIRYATKANYDASQMAQFFAMLERQEAQAPSRLPSWASTHPDPGERRETVLELAQEAKRRQEGPFEVGREEYLQAIDGLVYGNDPRQGYVREGSFVHPELALRFPIPRQWQVENTSSHVALSSPQGDAAVVMQLARETSPEAAAREFASQEGVEVRQQTAVQVAGSPAVRLQSRLAAEQPLEAVSTFLPWAGKTLVFHGVAVPDAFAAARSHLLAPVDGLQRVTDAAALSVQPVVVRAVRAQRAGPFAEVVAAYPIPAGAGIDMDGLAQLNGLEPGSQVEVGSTVKVLERRKTTLPAGTRDAAASGEEAAAGTSLRRGTRLR